MSFSPLRQLGYSHLYHHLNPASPSFTYIAAFETKVYILICTVIWNSMDLTMSESPNSPDEVESLVQLSKSYQLLEQSAGCLPRDHCLKPKFEELMGDLEAEILRMKKGSEGFRQTPPGSASIDTPPAGSSSPSPNIARPKPERRPTPDFFPHVENKPPLTGFTPQKDSEMQNPGGRKSSRPHSLHSRPSGVEKKRKIALTQGQKDLRNIRKERKERAKMFF